MINNTIKLAIDKQATHELYAAHSYSALSMWCEANDYGGYAKFFKQQAAEEFEHAEKFFDHALERGALPAIGAISAPKSDYQDLLSVAEAALALEQANTAGIVAVYELSLAEKDYPSQSMLQWFISEQMEEESWAESMVTKTKRAQCSGALLYLDRHICKELGAD
ncbi:MULTISPECIES: ferritin [unclassified Lentimonas]|uniref:ferritin n=1 Tax=unclassified Lentimonas TaxID=2630993 RepID=UPI00132C19D8|nr:MULTISPECIES: ferritin [unclassified Lentimonas]CAA6694973.1 Unannotated [Lentimonas sp. CC19]CAA6695321.1 Unannotated [Lentimonas sp. CC10]CAA7072005.1 Unannotated [Lentimonas sp. CC11]